MYGIVTHVSELSQNLVGMNEKFWAVWAHKIFGLALLAKLGQYKLKFAFNHAKSLSQKWIFTAENLIFDSKVAYFNPIKIRWV